MMDAEEREIFFFLRREPDTFVPAHSINRHAGGKRKHRESPNWASPVLLRMMERGILETNPTGAFRLKPIPAPETADRSPQWVSPQIAELLRKSGKKFDAVIRRDLDPEAYYDSL